MTSIFQDRNPKTVTVSISTKAITYQNARASSTPGFLIVKGFFPSLYLGPDTTEYTAPKRDV